MRCAGFDLVDAGHLPPTRPPALAVLDEVDLSAALVATYTQPREVRRPNRLPQSRMRRAKSRPQLSRTNIDLWLVFG
jgi:hypothetical protein